MGICPLDPQIRIINDRNKELLDSIRQHLSELKAYGFAQPLRREVDNMQPRYLYNAGILEDLMKTESYLKSSTLKGSSQSISGGSENLEEQIRSSCLILENQADNAAEQQDEIPQQANPADSFQHNMKQNKSLVVQINIIYRPDINREEYSQSLRLFLKWAQIFQEHSYGGFLKPLYSAFCMYLYQLPAGEYQTVVDETAVFVQLMVGIVTEIYGLKQLAAYQCGKLIKNENVYNLIMGIIFKRTKIKRFLLRCIRTNDQKRIHLFQSQLARFKGRHTYFFGISSKFTLTDTSLTESQINKSIEENGYVQPYVESLKLVNQLCKSGTPVTKLKTIVNISKEITKEIKHYYQVQSKEPPELDPDNLSSIVMYLLVKNGSAAVYQQLKIVQRFTTTNCLNCISGFYLNVFMAAIESIMTLDDD